MVLKIIRLVNSYKENNLPEKIKSAKSQKEVFDSLMSQRGLGQFLSYQVFVDLTYLKEFTFSENEFTIAGPGCKKGLGLIFKDLDGLSHEEALFWFRDNQNKIFAQFNYNPQELFIDLPTKDRALNVMSLENCMCEISKYIRALNGSGRPRIRYKGI